MKNFGMCDACAKEFKDLAQRRFHAQPDCCPSCGPVFTLYSIDGMKINTLDPILKATSLLGKGKIIAIKGIGGFHIACDATNRGAVMKLRRLKNRPTKPFAIMAKVHDLSRIVHIDKEERRLINSPVAPIMLLKKRNDRISEEVAPNNPYLGVMVPYAPVHYLILDKIPYLVMTSANIQDEPIAISDNEVRTKLKALVSFYLTHNREILNRCDDSVGFNLPAHGFSIIRRSRGYAPVPVELPVKVKPSLAVGPYLKNTFTVAHHKEAYISPHIGDLDNLETMSFFNEMVRKYKRWFKIKPELIIYDLHPDYMSTKIAMEGVKGERPRLKRVAVQHHIAHIAACLGENMVFDRTIGIAFDGTGFGLDKNIWGGEFFIGDLRSMQRAAHLEYLPLPGGEASIKKPYRIAVAYLHKLFGKGSQSVFVKGLRLNSTKEFNAITNMIDHNYNLAYTSSMGRLFDCVAAMLGVTKEITYEAEAAINLEYMTAKKIRGCYSYDIDQANISQGNNVSGFIPGQLDPNIMVIRVAGILAGIITDIENGVNRHIIAARFHNTVCRFSLDIAEKLRRLYAVNNVCLSGGVFQNRYLLTSMMQELENAGFKVYTHQKLPTNDGCISYGQVIIGNVMGSK